MDIGGRTLDLIWRQSPDRALEAGRLPPVLWEDISETGSRRIVAEAESLLADLKESVADERTRAAVRFHLRCVKWRAGDHGLGILNHMTGPVARLSWAARSWPVLADPTCETYREWLAAFPSYAVQVIARVNRAGPPGRDGSRTVLEAFVTQTDAFLAAHRSNPQPLLAPIELAATRGQSLQPVPSWLVANVLGSLADLRALAISAWPSAYAASPLPHRPDGAVRYAEAMFEGTSTSRSAEEVETLGQTILSRTKREFERAHESRLVRADPLPTPDQLLQLFERTHLAATADLSPICLVQPIMPCDVVAMPRAHAAVGPPAYYGQSSIRNNRNGSLYVNTAEPVVTHTWEVLPLVLHEGVPGHHLQLALLDEDESLPDLLRLESVNAFTEGWAVYAETLAPALRMDLTPADEFGLMAHQRWRAARLVVDVGLHVRSWSVEQAASFLSAVTDQDPLAARREVVRYIAWPGQALGYAVGADVIGSWVHRRTAAGSTLADAHSAVLAAGSVPLEFFGDTTSEGPAVC